MKKINALLPLMIISALSSLAGSSQEGGNAINALLPHYLAVKNDLVKGNSLAAGKAAADFLSAVKTVDTAKLTSVEKNAFNTARAKMITDVAAIAGTNDLAKQRAVFQSLSETMIAFVKLSTPSSPVYVDYCPMKKASWLSAEKEIRNPYYGNAMLNCGQVTEIIK